VAPDATSAIASALVGIGLLSLWRTDPRHPAPGANLAARSAEFLETAKGKAEDASAALHERAGQVRSAAGEWMDSTGEAVGNAIQASQETIETVRQRGQEMLPVAADGARAVMSRIGESPHRQRNATKSFWALRLWRSLPQ
jgi:hypothetical protein